MTSRMRELTAKATPGPWTAQHGGDFARCGAWYLIEAAHKTLGPFQSSGTVVAHVGKRQRRGYPDQSDTETGVGDTAAFIAASRDFAPLALAVIEAARRVKRVDHPAAWAALAAALRDFDAWDAGDTDD